MVLRGRHAAEGRRFEVSHGDHPRELGIGVYSLPLDPQGNSVRGIKVCQDISNEFELHAFNTRTNGSVIRRVYRGPFKPVAAPCRNATCSRSKASRTP